MRFDCLDDWLLWQESLNPAEIDLGLDRISKVLQQAELLSTFSCPLITVAGTNGKGSVVAMLEGIAIAAGLKVCSYTSPHIFKYNERIKVNGEAVSDDVLCNAFARIDEARLDAELTYFEFGTLAAIEIFFSEQPDLVILEVGLGGRLDAVNIMDADVSILTSVSIDHVDWLGDSRELIGYEKAGVFRSQKPVVCGDRNPPLSVINFATEKKCEFLQIGRDYDVSNPSKGGTDLISFWDLQSCYGDINTLPVPSLLGEFQKANAATAIVALQTLLDAGEFLQGQFLKWKKDFNYTVVTGLQQVDLPGRFQLINEEPQVFVDVAHNPQAAKALAMQIQSLPNNADNKTWGIVAMLADKDIEGVLKPIAEEIDCWCFAGLASVNRGLSVAALNKLGHDIVTNRCTIPADIRLTAETVVDACELVLLKANKDDRIIIFGSFYTVAEAMQFFQK